MEKPKKNPLKISRLSTIFEKSAKILIYSLVFMAPLFFLPWTSNILDYNKQTLLFVLVFFALIFWLAKVLIEKRLEFNSSFLSISVFILVLVTGISALYSISPYGSFWGWPLNISTGLTTVFFFALLYFLIANLFKEKKELSVLFILLLLSGTIAGIFGGLQLYKVFLFPWSFAKSISFNTIGTVNSLALFLSSILVLAVALTLGAKKPLKYLFLGNSILIFTILLLINTRNAWLVLLAGLTALMGFTFLNLKKTKNTNWFILPASFMVVSLFLILFRISLPGLPATPTEVSLTPSAEVKIAKSVLLGKNLMLGTGPGTFIYDYSKFKTTDLNRTFFWDFRFSSGSSEMFDKLITTGVVGVFALLIIYIIFFWRGFLSIKKNIGQDDFDWFLPVGIFSGFVAVAVAYFLYPVNFSLALLFWLFLAVLSSLDRESIKNMKLEASSAITLLISFTFVFVIVFGIGFLVFVGQKYVAETRYVAGLDSYQQGNIDNAIQAVSGAITLNQDMDIYWRDLSQIYIQKIGQEMGRNDVPAEQLNKTIQALVDNALSSSKRATDLEPQNVANWNVRGFVSRNIGATQDALDSYKKSSELEPNNPYIYTEIGRTYLEQYSLLGQQQGKTQEQDAALTSAQENFERAIQLKEDYAPARFQLALVLATQGKTKEAIAKLEETKQVAPQDVGVAFQLGVLYYNDKQYEKAQLELERAVELAEAANQEYANARYFLGLVYDKEGFAEKAIEQFEKLQATSPDNQDIKAILENIRAGKPALEGLVPGELPIEEPSPEILNKR